jgi:hypothetical protein
MKSHDSVQRWLKFSTSSWFRAGLSLLIAGNVSACRGSPAVSLDAAAESYVRLVLALGERDADSLDTYYGPEAWQADARARRRSLVEIREATVALVASLDERRFAEAESNARRLFLVRQLRAMVSRIDIVRGARQSFAEEARMLFGLEGRERQDGQEGKEQEVRSELERLLAGPGTLSARYADFDRRFLIPRDRLPAVLARAIDGCRAATREHLTLPAGERVDVEYVPDMAWSAFTRYRGRTTSRLQINTALPLTVDRALDLACHEAYPGHHTIDSLLDARFGGGRAEFVVRPLFSPQSLLHEAAASMAGEMAFPGQARLAFERDELFPLAGIDPSHVERYVRVGRLVDQLHDVQARIARQYLDGELDFSRASAALERGALMPSADTTLKFLNQFRTYAATYTIGRDRLSRYLDAQSTVDDRASRWRAYINVVTDASQIVPSEASRK